MTRPESSPPVMLGLVLLYLLVVLLAVVVLAVWRLIG